MLSQGSATTGVVDDDNLECCTSLRKGVMVVVDDMGVKGGPEVPAVEGNAGVKG
jgi:hypothetical protein